MGKHTNTRKTKQNPIGILLEKMCTLPHGLTWIRSSHGQQVNGAVIGGSEHGGMYVGRVNHHSGDILPGKVHCEHGVIYVPYGGKEHNFSSYEVLTEVDPSNSSIGSSGWPYFLWGTTVYWQDPLKLRGDLLWKGSPITWCTLHSVWRKRTCFQNWL